MKKAGSRVLAWRLARDLRPEDWSRFTGHGTSFYPSGHVDSRGRGEDAFAGDCVEGEDVYIVNR